MRQTPSLDCGGLWLRGSSSGLWLRGSSGGSSAIGSGAVGSGTFGSGALLSTDIVLALGGKTPRQEKSLKQSGNGDGEAGSS